MEIRVPQSLTPGSICKIQSPDGQNHFVRIPPSLVTEGDHNKFVKRLPRKYEPKHLRDLDVDELTHWMKHRKIDKVPAAADSEDSGLAVNLAKSDEWLIEQAKAQIMPMDEHSGLEDEDEDDESGEDYYSSDYSEDEMMGLNLHHRLAMIYENWQTAELIPVGMDQILSLFSLSAMKLLGKYWGLPKLLISATMLDDVADAPDSQKLWFTWILLSLKGAKELCDELLHPDFDYDSLDFGGRKFPTELPPHKIVVVR